MSKRPMRITTILFVIQLVFIEISTAISAYERVEIIGLACLFWIIMIWLMVWDAYWRS